MLKHMMWLAVALVLAGCTVVDNGSTTQSSAERQKNALNDPMKYSPEFDRSITGGGLNEYDSKAMKKDTDGLLLKN